MTKKEGYYNISHHITDQLNKLSEKEKHLIADAIEFYMAQYKHVKNQVDPASTAYNFNTHVDELIKETPVPEGEKISCKKGCSYCCHLHVEISQDEAVLILKHAKENNIPINWDRLKKQSKHDLDTYGNMPAKKRKCNFLGSDGSCTIYEVRPINCRKMFSLDDPDKCDIGTGIRNIKKFVHMKAEIVNSAIATVSEFGSMSKMLLKIKGI